MSCQVMSLSVTVLPSVGQVGAVAALVPLVSAR
jgi:hypothetical protein